MLAALRSGALNAHTLPQIAYTLQVGREAMEHRLALQVRAHAELEQKLTRHAAGESGIEELYRGEVKAGRETLGVFAGDEELQEAIGRWMQRGKYGKLLELWVKGLKFDWDLLYPDHTPRRVSLPTYPFARTRCWLPFSVPSNAGTTAEESAHPLIQRNVSSFSGQCYRSRFSGREFFLSDHVVGGKRVFPGSCIALDGTSGVAGGYGLGPQAGKEGDVSCCLEEVTWLRPMECKAGGLELEVGLEVQESGDVRFEIRRAGAGEDGLHCVGRASFDQTQATEMDLQALRERCAQTVLGGQECYERLASSGIEYRGSFQAIERLGFGAEEVFAELF